MPTIAPFSVTKDDSSTYRTSPKSASFASPSPSKMFAGLMSRWMTPRAWSSATAEEIGRTTSRARAGERPFATQQLRQRLALDELHHEVGDVPFDAEVDHRHDVRVAELTRGARLPEEALPRAAALPATGRTRTFTATRRPDSSRAS